MINKIEMITVVENDIKRSKSLASLSSINETSNEIIKDDSRQKTKKKYTKNK
jgi:hypothetical protein